MALLMENSVISDGVICHINNSLPLDKSTNNTINGKPYGF